MSLSVKTRIYIKLKSNPGLSVDDLYKSMDGQVPKDEILDIIDRESDYIERKKDENDTERFYIKIVLDKVRRRPAGGFWEYDEIVAKRRTQTAVPSGEEEILPVRGSVIAERSQGNVGACVGSASATLMDDIHMSLCEEDWPTEEEKAEYKHNVDFYENKPGVAYYDNMWFQSFSLAGIYWRSKQIFNVPGQGSYIDYALETIRREGAGRDRQWIHMKDGMHAFREPYPDKCPETGEIYFETASKHKIDGYARCSTTSSMVQALKDHNGVGLLAAMEIAEGTFNSAHGNGIWQTWKGASLGGHAIVIKGRKKRGSVWGWIFYNSWCDQGYPREEWMSDAYWNKAKIDCFVALDSEEASFARKKVYQHVTLTTNKPSKAYIDGKYWGDTVDNKIGAEVTIGKHKFKAECIENKTVKELEVEVTKDTTEVNLFFEDSDPNPTKPINIAELIKAFKEFLKKVFRRG